jgi:DNA invertase Pin-like site-specific DNA recombinase
VAKTRPRQKRIAPLEPRILELFGAGLTKAEIARRLGITDVTVRAVIRHHEAMARGEAATPRRPPGRRPIDLSPEAIADMRARRAAGESYHTIAKAHGVSYATPYRLLNAPAGQATQP